MLLRPKTVALMEGVMANKFFASPIHIGATRFRGRYNAR